MILAFSSFELDTDRCTLKRGRETLALRPQCYDLLLLLLKRSGTVVARQEIVDRIWQGIAVTDDSLTQCVGALRQVLGPEGARIIRTVPRRGYLLDADVSTRPPAGIAGARDRRRLPAAARTGLALAAAAVVASLVTALALRPEVVRPREVLVTSSTILDQPVAYPAGAPLLVSGILLLAPGESSEWHTHPAPLFAYILSGEVAVDYGPHGTRKLRKGSGIIEAVDTPHRATNISARPAEILYLSIGAEGLSPRIVGAAPG